MIPSSWLTGYRMIKTFTMKRFRGFKDLKIDDLRRINVIVGPNATGKTALLEARGTF